MAPVQEYPGSQTASKHAIYPFLSGSETCLRNDPLQRTDIQLTIKESFRACMLSPFNPGHRFVTLWTVACWALLSLDSSGENTGVGCHAFLQGVFPTQWLNQHLLHCFLHCGWILYHWTTREAPTLSGSLQKKTCCYHGKKKEILSTAERLHFHFSLSCIGEGNGNPLQCSRLENPRDGGAW